MSILRAAYLILLAALICSPQSKAQQPLQKCWVYFTDKDSCGFDPLTYFAPKAIDRRNKMGIDLNDPLCWPLRQTYSDSINHFLEERTATLRWFNAVAGYARPSEIRAIESLDFVRRVEVSDRAATIMEYPEATAGLPLETEYNNRVWLGQTGVMGRSAFESEGLTGKGVCIAVLDAGFKGVDHNPVFAHLFERGRIKATKDFVKNRDFVYAFSTHGSYVLSCMAGILDSLPMGLASDAEFLLIRTERDKLEFRGEEENWLEGMEFADRMGADIINSSLGYTWNRYYQFDMNGNTAGVTQAASIAARLGMLVVNAAGNEGDNWWQVIAAPGDGDSVLTVGGVDPYNRLRADFSSFGPTSDGRTKPNVSAFAWAYASSHTGEQLVPGTSFSSPLVAGFAACVWQKYPELTNMEVFDRIQQAGHLYPYYDYAHGYGIPQASRILGGKPRADTTFDVRVEGSRLYILPRKPEQEPADSLSGTVDPEEEFAMLPDVVYVHFKHLDGRLSYYSTYEHFSFSGPRSELLVNLKGRKGQIIRIYYNGYLYERKLE